MTEDAFKKYLLEVFVKLTMYNYIREVFIRST